MPPLIAIVGRPNVGKSTLFNRLAGRGLAIVHDAPGVTRDRHYADTHLFGRDLVLVDTGGFDPDSDDPMQQGIARQVELAIREADVVLCVLDATLAPTAADRETVGLLRRSEKPVVYVANKADNPRAELESNELYALGVERVVPISALHGRGLAELEAALAKVVPPEEAIEPPSDDAPPRVALVGRPNAGKSSLFNWLAGSARSLVDHRPGTTRDAIDQRVEHGGHAFTIVDTAGIRRKSRVDRGVEAESVMRSIKAVGRADLVILMCDAAEGVAEQDARLLTLCAERGRAIVVGLNKIDLLRTRKERDAAEERARDELRFARWAPIVRTSAKTGEGIDDLMQTAWRAAEEYRRRVPTGELNRFFEQVLSTHPPPTHGGRAPRIYYVTQAETSPPVFVAMSNAPESIKDSYKRFVVGQLRKAFGFESVPVMVRYRRKSRREPG